jgi:tetratricopeptide (TPR) repeat protein
MVLLAHNYYVEAIASFENAERFNPHEYLWPYLQGVALAVADPQAAEPALARAAALRPELPYVRLRLVELLLDRRAFEAAETHLQDVLQINEHDARAELGMGRLAYERGDLNSSLEWVVRSVQHAPDQRAALELQARLLHRLARVDDAQRVADRLQRLPPGPTNWDDPAVASVLRLRRDPDWEFHAAQERFQVERSAESLEHLARVAARHPERAEYVVELARAYELVGDFRRAAEVIDAALARRVQAAELHRLRGIAFLAESDLPAARSAFERSIALKPDAALAWENLGECLRRGGVLPEAVEAWCTAMRLQPDSPSACGGLGRTLLDADRASEAIEPLRRAVELAPESADWRRLLETAQRP